MKPLRIVFFGTPEFAKRSLQAIDESQHRIVGVVSATDKQAGRGRHIKKSPVKEYAEEKKMPIFQPEKLKNPDFLAEMKALRADIFVVVAFRMMPRELFLIPPMGSFNLHASLLPDYRGAAPINHALINGEKSTGVTSFLINEKIDEGQILLQKSVEISEEDNAGSLHDKLMEEGAKLVVETLDGLGSGSILGKPQKEPKNIKLAPKIFKPDTRIEWNKKSKEVHHFIRGLSPYPGAFTLISLYDQNKVLKIYSGSYQERSHHTEPGSLEMNKDELKIYTEDGVYFPKEVQLEGKKRMHVTEFLNGLRL